MSRKMPTRLLITCVVFFSTFQLLPAWAESQAQGRIFFHSLPIPMTHEEYPARPNPFLNLEPRPAEGSSHSNSKPTHRQTRGAKVLPRSASNATPAIRPFVPRNFSLRETQLMNWLLERIYPETGLVESFAPTSDFVLQAQASTYDQALAGLTFLYLGRTEEARRIGDFYAGLETPAFSNFYNCRTGNPGIEIVKHLGPNAWMGLFLTQLYHETRYPAYLATAEKLIKWSLQLNSFHGARTMSNDDEWRAQWSRVVSTENNLSLYAFLQFYLLVQPRHLPDAMIQEELADLDNFFNRFAVARHNEIVSIARGAADNRRDTIQALDTYSWLILAMDEAKREQLGIPAKAVMSAIERQFKVTDQGVTGFDFTNQQERDKINRDPLVSVEWTCGVINAYLAMYSENQIQGEVYDIRARKYLNQIEKLFFQLRSDIAALPYATRPNELVFQDSHWWKTPRDGYYYRAGSVASACWYLMCTRINPMRPLDPLYTPKRQSASQS